MVLSRDRARRAGAEGRRRRGGGRPLVRTAAALDAATEGELFLVFPTIKHLEQLSGFRSAEALLAHARGREVLPVQPRVVVSGETARILLPGDPGYED